MKPILLAPLLAAALLAQPGAQTFSAQCALCHGPGGRGTERGPNLASNRRVRARSIDEVKAVIRDGVPPGMPAFKLADLDAVTAFVRAMSVSAADANAPGDRAAGEAFFHGAGGCAKCHMALGRGIAVGPDLSNIGRELTLAELDDAVRKPSAKIKSGYQTVNVTLRNGRVIKGFARNRNRYNIQLQDPGGRIHSLHHEQTAQITPRSRSRSCPSPSAAIAAT